MLFEANDWLRTKRKGSFNTADHRGNYQVPGVYSFKQPAIAIGQIGMVKKINSGFDHHIFSQLGGQAFAPNLRTWPSVESMLVFSST